MKINEIREVGELVTKTEMSAPKIGEERHLLPYVLGFCQTLIGADIKGASMYCVVSK